MRRELFCIIPMSVYYDIKPNVYFHKAIFYYLFYRWFKYAYILVTTILAIEKHLGSQHLDDNDYIISAVIEEWEEHLAADL